MLIIQIIRVLRVMPVITRIICNICDICIILIFKYFELNNDPMWVMRDGFKLSISALRVMQVFESRRGGFRLARPRYASICKYLYISNIFLIFEHAYRKRIMIGHFNHCESGERIRESWNPGILESWNPGIRESGLALKAGFMVTNDKCFCFLKC